MSTPYPDLESCEAAITTAEELLYRQIPSHNWDDQAGRPKSHAFGPAPIDKGRASHTRSNVVSAQDSRDWHNEFAKSESTSVWANSVAEVQENELRSVDDQGCAPAAGEPDKPPGHCYVDYRHLAEDKKEERRVRGLLFKAAVDRGEIATD